MAYTTYKAPGDKSYVIECRRCMREIHINAPTKKQAEAKARAQGWGTRHDEWRCPDQRRVD